MRVARVVLFALFSGSAFGQSTETAPRFEIADVHVSPKSTNTRFPFRRTGPARGGRYEVRTATMVDLISIAYGFGEDKVLGGPSWLEMDRFDVIGKVPADSTVETHKLMLQSLLAERFGLKVHKDTKPLPTYALVVGKKPLMKEADGNGETGCKLQSAPAGPPPTEGGAIRIGINGVTTILGPGGTLQYQGLR